MNLVGALGRSKFSVVLLPEFWNFEVTFLMVNNNYYE